MFGPPLVSLAPVKEEEIGMDETSASSFPLLRLALLSSLAIHNGAVPTHTGVPSGMTASCAKGDAAAMATPLFLPLHPALLFLPPPTPYCSTTPPTLAGRYTQSLWTTEERGRFGRALLV
ncbi:hypothetical protein DPEC_G00101120 [Dallia pectoralis]|uniref:Uncharacterized protein n=1 Tax=Dallia pectoralis TaxID=75939 RepID=A0ACC2GWP4_DALPE|nr:hypothetical protein DPEC_G00101120 [Dallia pectoralis]